MKNIEDIETSGDIAANINGIKTKRAIKISEDESC